MVVDLLQSVMGILTCAELVSESVKETLERVVEVLNPRTKILYRHTRDLEKRDRGLEKRHRDLKAHHRGPGNCGRGLETHDTGLKTLFLPAGKNVIPSCIIFTPLSTRTSVSPLDLR